MSGEEIGIDDIDVTVKLLLTTNIEGKLAHFAAHFTVLVLYP